VKETSERKRRFLKEARKNFCLFEAGSAARRRPRLYEEIRFRFCAMQNRMLLSQLEMLRSKMFFVRVNRFWCVWIRAPVAVGLDRGLVCVFGNGLSDLGSGSPRAMITRGASVQRRDTVARAIVMIVAATGLPVWV